MERATPIVIDPEMTRILRSTGPSIEDIENHTPRRRTVSSDHHGSIGTLDELIDVLETYRERFGGDATVESFEGGHKIHVCGREYDNGDKVVEL